MGWEEIYSNAVRKVMMTETIEIKNSRDALKAMKYSILALLIGIIISIFLAPMVTSSILGLILGTVVLVPVLGIMASISILRNVPMRIELYPDHAHFIYWHNISNKPPNMYWVDVVDFQIFGRITDRFGNSINPVYLSREEYKKIQEYLKRALKDIKRNPQKEPSDRNADRYSDSTPDFSDLPPGAEPRQIVSNPGIAEAAVTKAITEIVSPDESLTISKRPLDIIIVYSIVAVLSGILTFFVASGSAYSEPEDFSINLIISSLFLLMTLLSIFGVYNASRKRELTINEWGVEAKVGGKVEFRYSWSDLENIFLSATGGRTFTVTLGFKSYESRNLITSNEFRIEDMKKAFELIRKYAVYHNIPIKNEVGW